MEELLKEEVKQKEILEYFEKKYHSPGIVSQKTIKNWLDELGIDCIQPRPARNADIRYKKSDVLRLENEKKENLIKKQHKGLWANQKRDLAKEERYKRNEFYESLIRHNALSREEQMAQSMQLSLSLEADEIIRQDMIEMCFKKLFPNLFFDKEELMMKLYESDNNTINTDIEKGDALSYLERKIYIKEKRK